MIHKIRENIGTIVICTVIIFGVPAAVSAASTTDAPAQVNTPQTSAPTQAVMIEIPVQGSSGGGGGIAGAGGSLGDN